MKTIILKFRTAFGMLLEIQGYNSVKYSKIYIRQND